MKPILFITKMDGGGMETFCLGLLQQLTTPKLPNSQTPKPIAYATLYTSYSGGARELDVPPNIERVCWDVRAKKCWCKMARWLRTRPDDPCLCLSQELCVVLVILKRLHLIRNRIYFRESTDVERHYDARYWRTMRHILPHCDGLIEQSHVGLEATRRLCGAALPKCLVVRNMVAPSAQTSNFKPQTSNVKPQTSNVKLIYPASFKPMKGHEWLVRNTAEVLGNANDWRITFFGEGERREACERLVKERGLEERFIFKDWMADKDVLYANADCVVIPSDYEGLPNVMLEAILYGRRVAVRPTCTGACELLAELGLPPTWPVSAAMAIPEACWRQAREKLTALCDPARVADEVMEFMRS